MSRRTCRHGREGRPHSSRRAHSGSKERSNAGKSQEATQAAAKKGATPASHRRPTRGHVAAARRCGSAHHVADRQCGEVLIGLRVEVRLQSENPEVIRANQTNGSPCLPHGLCGGADRPHSVGPTGLARLDLSLHQPTGCRFPGRLHRHQPRRLVLKETAGSPRVGLDW